MQITDPLRSAARFLRRPHRTLLGGRAVRRSVQGVELVLPYAHRLPDYARSNPRYGQNLVELAALVDEAQGPLRMVDVGANVGDSALQVLNAVPHGRVLCVEGDPYWLGWLARNVGADPRVEVEPALLATSPAQDGLTAVRARGTTSFVAADAGRAVPGSPPVVTAASLAERHPDFVAAGLLKLDTDGYDTILAPTLAAAFSAGRPVLFLEYDPGMVRTVAGADPHRVWTELEALGMSSCLVWTNAGDLLGHVRGASAMAEAGRGLERSAHRRRVAYWDVAVFPDGDVRFEQAAARFGSTPLRTG